MQRAVAPMLAGLLAAILVAACTAPFSGLSRCVDRIDGTGSCESLGWWSLLGSPAWPLWLSLLVAAAAALAAAAVVHRVAQRLRRPRAR